MIRIPIKQPVYRKLRVFFSWLKCHHPSNNTKKILSFSASNLLSNGSKGAPASLVAIFLGDEDEAVRLETQEFWNMFFDFC